VSGGQPAAANWIVTATTGLVKLNGGGLAGTDLLPPSPFFCRAKRHLARKSEKHCQTRRKTVDDGNALPSTI
jgi:hypothetical protein